jgi:hypothetical protein
MSDPYMDDLNGHNPPPVFSIIALVLLIWWLLS